MDATAQVEALRAKGLLTLCAVSRLLGIPETSLRRLQGTVFEARRYGRRQFFGLTVADIEAIRRWQSKPRRDET
jgi:hypothetical protein